MTPTQRWPKDLILSRYLLKQQQQFHRKVEAMERFVLINAIALGVLQLLSLEMPMTVWKDFPRWFRTLPSNGYPSEQIVLLTQQRTEEVYFSQKYVRTTFDKILKCSIIIYETVDNGAFLLHETNCFMKTKTFYCPVTIRPLQKC